MKKSIWLIPLLFGLNVLFIGCDEPTAGTVRSQEMQTKTVQMAKSAQSGITKRTVR